MSNKQLLSIVVPVLNESEVIQTFYGRLRDVLEALPSFDSEVIFVDDGSRDDSYRKLVALADADPRIKAIKFSRNFGHQIAITAGIDLARGDAVVVIDADLQDPPELIGSFIEKWKQGYEVVYGCREHREGESRMKKWTASLFYRTLRALIKIDIPVDVGDFRLMSRTAADYLRKFKERDRFIRGLVSWVGFRQTGVTYARDKRWAGKTKYPYRKMIKFAIDGITSFSSLPLRLASWFGFIVSVLAFLYLASVFVQKALGNTIQGWATIMVGMLLLGGVQLICLGIIGEYIGRIFNETKQRPLYVIEGIYAAEGATSKPSGEIGEGR